MNGKRFSPRWANVAPLAGLLLLCFLWSLGSLRIDLLPSLNNRALPVMEKQALPFGLLAITASIAAGTHTVCCDPTPDTHANIACDGVKHRFFTNTRNGFYPPRKRSAPPRVPEHIIKVCAAPHFRKSKKLLERLACRRPRAGRCSHPPDHTRDAASVTNIRRSHPIAPPRVSP